MKKIIFLVLMASIYPYLSSAQLYDVVVYGATPAGIIAAVAAARNNARVILIEPTNHVGGLNTSGLVTAEANHLIDKAITGLAREFYIRMGQNFTESYYDYDKRFSFQKGDPAFFFESHIAENEFNQMLKEAGVKVVFEKYVDQVMKQDHKIKQVIFTDGESLSGVIFIDCSYEGDLMARAGVSYTWGRESNAKYNESYAGIRFIDDTLTSRTVDKHGKILPYFSENKNLNPGQGDNRVMNYNFRPTMTRDINNMRKVIRPENYDSTRYQLLADFLEKYPDTNLKDLIGVYPRGNGKFEFNNRQNSTISLGLFGGNVDYPDADYAQRHQIYQNHKNYTLGYLYFLGHDPRVPDRLKQQMLSYGFAADEFVDNDNFPYYLYIREARRMIGDFVLTQPDILSNRSKPDAVTLGSHWIDSHHVQRVAISDTTFTNEGRIWHKVTEPFEIPYRILLPKSTEANNLLVPVASSVSHVAFCAFRLEPTWMQMGHVAGTAAALSLRNNCVVTDLSLADLQYQLRLEGMIFKIDDLGPYDEY
ncbi:MAG: FAD-dependent oxidoreductase [Candidatus Cyclobacteriaceae bacterium M3_2C_046]